VLREFRSPLIGILGNTGVAARLLVDVILDASVEREADPHNWRPPPARPLLSRS
jgi:hypothetical protein